MGAMRFCPSTGHPDPVITDPDKWREKFDGVAWLYNPWTGNIRSVSEINRDIFGEHIESKSS
jgi:hypothetical protein